VRICSLLPSATEIIAHLGLGDHLVGVSEECDWPPAVRDLPVVSAARIDTAAMTGAEIDRAVREAVADGRPLYALDADLLDRLDPDVIVTQDLCAVCAVSSDQVGLLGGVRADVVSLDPHSIAGIEGAVLQLAGRLGAHEAGRAVVARMEGRLESVRAAVAGLRRPRVFLTEWLDPPYAAGHWVPEMVELAGGLEVLGRAGEPSVAITWEAVRAAEPELLVLAPCGYDADRAADEADLSVLPARAVAVDANSYYSRPAPRVVDGVEQLAFLFHPDSVADPGLPWIELVPVVR
jgi:iron complex transport system substrate-binding protein